MRLVEAVSRYQVEDTAPSANAINFVMDDDTTKNVASEDSITDVKSVAERLNEFVLQGEQLVRYRDEFFQRTSGGGT